MSFKQIKELLEEKRHLFIETDYTDILSKLSIAEEKALSMQPSQESISKAENFKQKGNDHYKNKNYYDAIYSYTDAIEHDPTNPIYFSNRAAAYASLNLSENGIDDCLKAIELDKKYTKAYIRLGDFYTKTDVEKARTYYQQALDLEPTNIQVSKKLENLVNPQSTGKNNKGPGNMDLNELFKNPDYMKAAQDLMKGKSKEEIMEMIKNMSPPTQ